MNSWSFTGNLGSDAGIKYVGDTSVTEFAVAVTSGWGNKKATTWVKCSYWGKPGEATEPYLKKGQQVAVTGEATLRTYDKEDGSKGFSMELKVRDLTLIGGRAEKPAQANTGGFRDKPAPADSGVGEDDIPF